MLFIFKSLLLYRTVEIIVFYHSISYCGGAVWEEGVGNDFKRREFWEWFLNDAVFS